MGGEVRPFGQLFVEPTRNGLTRPKTVRGNGVKMVNMGELFAYPRLCNAPMERVPLRPSEYERFLLKEGDLLFARQSLVLEGAGKCSIFLGDDEAVTFESHITRVRLDPTKANPCFYFYYFQSHHGRAAIRSIVEQGAGASGIRGSDLESLDVQWCPLPEQRTIANILGTLDDKIDLNRRMSETLEQMARALFKSWFVDFDPVRAKMDGRWRRGESLPGLPPDLYDLFPNRLVDSELGEIPEGWEVKPIGDLADVVGGSTPKTERSEYWEGGTHHWVTPKDLSGLSMPVLLDTERKITDAGLAQISSGLLPEGTVLLASRAPIGYLAIAEIPVAVNQGFIAMKPRRDMSNLFLLRWARSAHEDIVSQANGSTFLEISKSSFRAIRTVAPAASVMDAFDRISRSMYRKVVEHERESRTLAVLRDTLLPKLISGELRVKDAEKFLKERGL
jgi:type I restriction enzyme S subunit